MERRLPNSSVDRYVITLTQCTSICMRRTFPTSKMYACSATRIDVERAVPPYGRAHGSCVDTSVRVRGVCVECILVACTIRLHQYSNVWTTPTFESLRRCGTIRTEPPLTLSVGSTPNNFRWTVKWFTG